VLVVLNGSVACGCDVLKTWDIISMGTVIVYACKDDAQKSKQKYIEIDMGENVVRMLTLLLLDFGFNIVWNKIFKFQISGNPITPRHGDITCIVTMAIRVL
jgi:hypothetical protein